ncbi:hypothetical protein ACPC54_23765 [Kitasatospora sp. NPDC094028]
MDDTSPAIYCHRSVSREGNVQQQVAAAQAYVDELGFDATWIDGEPLKPEEPPHC